MNLLYMFLAIGSTVTFVAADSHHYNISTLLEVYTLTCGQHFCNHYDYNLPVTSHHSHICPYCSCDPSCIFYGDCCLDLYLSLNIQCINTTSISYMEHDSESVSEFEDFFIMKTTCPENTTVYLRQQCEGFKNVSEQVKLLPVTSKDTHFTYQNRFCAECNYDSNIELWSLNAVCDRPVDFNFMSNIEEILEATMINKCTFGSFLSKPFVRGCRKVYGENIISSCNVTGTWESYDPSIEWACRNYDNLYHTFRNVFCYICNPPVSMNPVIGQCNTTGDWDTFDNLHIKACNDLGHTPTTYPFKNVFCYACNINSNKKDYLLSQDAFKKIKESIHNERYFKYEFTSVIIANLADLFLAELKNVSHNQQKRKQNNLRTELYHKYYAMTGNGDFCTNVSNSIKQDGRCSCDEYCHFNLTNPCCIDAVFKKSTACVSSKNFDLLVYDGCENILEGSNPLVHKCLSTDMTNENNFLSLLPVTDTISSVNYRNIYCGLCRYFTNYDELYANQFIYLMETFRFWNFIYICEAPLPISYHVSFFELLNYKHQSKCNFTFDPVYCGKLCDKNKKGSCNDGNSSLEWACKNYNSPTKDVNFYYKLNDLSLQDGSNIFCAMCETESQVPTIDSCNSTGRWERYDETLKQKCISLPAVPYHRPYKNIFCKMCNEETQRYNGIYSIEQKCDLMDNYTKPILFRTLFSVLLHSDGEIYDSSKRTCEENEIFDSMIVRCREILCYPGRILINTRCVPLISYTSNLGYVLAFGIDFLLPFNVENPNTFMESIQEKIWSHIGVFVGLPDPFIEVSIISADRPCNVYDKWTVGNIHMTVFLKIFISRTVYRAKIEENLFKVMYSTFTFFLPCSVSSNVCQIGGKLRFDENALYLPTVLTFQSLQNKCVLNKVNNITNTAGYEHQQVSSLFGCSQIQLEKDEIKVTEDGRQLTINRFGVVLRYYEFLLMKNNSARICHSAFLDLLKVNEQTTPVVNTIMSVCTVLSLVALLFTFITYCTFPTLRTLPGKNNMNLVFSMFFAIGFLEFGIRGTSSKVLCLALGASIHFFWLSTFCCLNVCSIHMYRTFRQTFMINHSDCDAEKKRFAFYLIYSYAGPLLIVCLTVSSSYLSDKDLYGYDRKVCFIQDHLVLICTFIVPIMVICLVDLFLFISTVISIKSTPKINTKDSFIQNKVHYTVYVKLFVLTGSAWILQILDSFFPVSSFSIVVSFLNSFQGLYIFLAYNCNRRVLYLYQNQFKQMFTSCKTGKANKKTMTALVSSVPGKRFSFKDKTSSEYEYRQKLHTTKI